MDPIARGLAAKATSQANTSAAQAAAAGSKFYADTTAGLAGTTNGQYFLVAGDGVTTYSILYKNNAGAALKIADYLPSSAISPILDGRGGIYIRSSSAGGDVSDSTNRIVLESFQRPETGPFGETIRMLNKVPRAKSMLAWYHPEDPTLPYDATTNPMHSSADVWCGAHYEAQDTDVDVHGHWSVEVPDSGGALRSRFAIDWVNHATQTRGIDTTNTYFGNTHVSHRQGDGAIFRVCAGAGSAERKLEFSADGGGSTISPGQFDPLKRRWWLVCNQDAESGSNVGANFSLRRFADDGTSLGEAFFVQRVNGQITFGEASTQSSRVCARSAGAGENGFFSYPQAAFSSGFAHFSAKSATLADRVFHIATTGEANARFTMDSAGKQEWGNGTSSRDTVIERKQANVMGLGTDDAWRTGLSTTASRPTPASVGQGSQFFDTTLNKPIWSTGSAWVDAMGNAV